MPSLLAVLGLDKTQFTAGLNSAKSEARQAGESIGSALSSKITGALSVAAIGMALNSILQKVSDIKKESIETGYDTDAIQKFNFELTQMNIDINSGNTALGKMNELIGQAAMGEKKAVDTFARWGISTTGKSNVEIMDEIRQSILATADPAQRVAEAMEIFGRGGREMLPYLTAADGSLDAMAAHAPIISKEDIGSIEKAKQGLDELKDSLEVFGAKIIAPVAEGAQKRGLFVTIAKILTDPKAAAEEIKADNFNESSHGDGADWNPTPDPKKSKSISDLMHGIKPESDKVLRGDILNLAFGELTKGINLSKPSKTTSNPGEAHRVNLMMELSSMQKIGAYAAAPPGYSQMVAASLATAKHVASIDNKTTPHNRPSTKF